MIIFPGGKVNLTFYNEQLLKRFNFLPASLGAPRGQADQDDKFFTLQDKNFEHSIVSIWNDPGSGTLSSVRFYRAFQLKPAPGSGSPLPSDSPRLAPGAAGGRGVRDEGRLTKPADKASPQLPQDAGEPQIILKFADGQPAIMERTWGMGRVILFSSTANSAWNDWPVRLSFVPLVHRALGSIVQRQDEGLNIRVGEKFVRRVGSEFLDKDAAYHKPSQTDTMRDLRRIEVVNGWPTLQYEQTDLGGIYEVSSTEPPLALKFAAQPASFESSMDELSPAQVSVLKSVANVIPWTPNLSLRGMVEKDRTGLEFWLPIVIAALLVAAAETFLGQWFSRAK
jgi:hypothetical protein